MINLYIVRHGETIENTKNICQGQTDGTLSKKGIIENIKLANELKSIKFDFVYSSPLERAKLTCEAIISQHQNLQIHLDDRLKEWNMGKLQGYEFPKSLDIVNNEYDMESFDKVRDRCTHFLNDMFSHKHNSNILVVSHGLMIKMLESIILNKPYKEMYLMQNSRFKKIKCSL